MKHRVLWVEDGAFSELKDMSGLIYVSGRYDLAIALNATEGLRQLLRKDKEFETVIVDIRIPPGSDEKFVRLYSDRGESKVGARLGLALLERVLRNGEREGIPAHHREARRFGIFTVEGEDELKEDMLRLGIRVYHQKMETNSKSKLRDIIEEIRADNLSVGR
jgi:hypothetical protein